MMILEFLGICLVNAIIALVSGRPYKWSIVIISWVLFELIYAFFFSEMCRKRVRQLKRIRWRKIIICQKKKKQLLKTI